MDIANLGHIIELFGKFDENIKVIEEELDVQIIVRQTQLQILGKEKAVDTAYTVLTKLLDNVEDGGSIDKGKVRYLIELVKEGEVDYFGEFIGNVICTTYKGKQIKSKTLGQSRYVRAMRKNDIVFGIGPAGTGKTYLSMAMAVNAFKNKEISRIILTRPAVEAGEKLGFLPGDLQNKVDPYLRPLYDALHDLMGLETYTRLIERGVIEVAPLAYMRGRTLDDAFIILDEAQNTTSEQMKMFLTRLGIGSKAVINGDITQIDLPSGAKSGLVEAMRVLKGIKGIDFVHLTHRDVVRHELVMSIIRAYDSYQQKKSSTK
ncbi:MAG: PhoH family protein [Clostridiales bacterium]|nr:PhoH family protein [Clostridiales bacterium]